MSKTLGDYPEWSQYFKDHSCCPRCKGANLEQTTMSPNCWFEGDKLVVKDTNNLARCVCGWHGKVHDLLPENSK